MRSEGVQGATAKPPGAPAGAYPRTRDFAPAGATKGLSDRPLETFGAHLVGIDSGYRSRKVTFLCCFTQYQTDSRGQRRSPGGSERPENDPVDHFQRRTGGSPGPTAKHSSQLSSSTMTLLLTGLPAGFIRHWWRRPPPPGAPAGAYPFPRSFGLRPTKGSEPDRQLSDRIWTLRGPLRWTRLPDTRRKNLPDTAAIPFICAYL